MEKPATPEKPKKVEPVAQDVVDAVMLDEYCTRLSASDKRVELIGAFHHVEKKNRRFKDTEAAYQARFEAFVNKPV